MPDVVPFTARCACGNPDARYTETRVVTALSDTCVVTVECDHCPAPTVFTKAVTTGKVSDLYRKWLDQLAQRMEHA